MILFPKQEILSSIAVRTSEVYRAIWLVTIRHNVGSSGNAQTFKSIGETGDSIIYLGEYPFVHLGDIDQAASTILHRFGNSCTPALSGSFEV